MIQKPEDYVRPSHLLLTSLLDCERANGLDVARFFF